MSRRPGRSRRGAGPDRAGPEPPGVRSLVVRFPHWSASAAGVAATTPAVVLHANRVVDLTPAALDEGVEPGSRRREAQSRCPGLEVIEHDPSRDARRFEPIVAALGDLAARIEVTRPGVCLVPTRGPSRYHGGDAPLAARVRTVVDEAAEAMGEVGDVRAAARVGVADGPVPAVLAARAAALDERVLVVDPGGSARFLAPLPVTLLDEGLADAGELVGLLLRLGVRTLGDLAALPAADVLGRFGPEGALAHRLARGMDPRRPDVRPVPPDLEVRAVLDPPVERVEGAAFLARGLADELAGRLEGQGLACTRIAIEAVTDRDEHHLRVWRHDGVLRARDVAERVRWQLDGWLAAGPGARPSGGLARLVVRPDEVVADRGRQLGFWGGEAGVDDRVTRAVGRLEGLLGPGAVTVPELKGGRGPGDRIRLVPAVAVELSPDRRVPAPDGDAPWPGRVPAPAPAVVLPDPRPIEVLDAHGDPVVVEVRGGIRVPPASVAGLAAVPGVDASGPGPVEVVGWAGPWAVDERWWDPVSHRRRARLQLLLTDGRAILAVSERRRWWCEAIYD